MIRYLAAILGVALSFTAPAAANTTQALLPEAVAPGVEANPQTFRTPEGAYRMHTRCAPFEAAGVRYTGVRSRAMSCAQVRYAVKRDAPESIGCQFFPLVLRFAFQAPGITFYTASTARITCQQREPFAVRAFAFTGRIDAT